MSIPDESSPPAISLSSVCSFCLLTSAFCLLLLLAGCDQPARNDTTASPSPGGAKTWTDISVAKPEDRVTVHYHRRDNRYDGAEIWTWDGNQKTTPEQNVLAALGRDAFGTVYQFDRASYGGSDKIGLITRQGHDWNHKDGGDKFWTPALGHEVWLVSGKDTVLTKAPDVSPRVESAYLDAPGNVVVALTEQAPLPIRVVILDQNDAAHAVKAAVPAGASWHPAGVKGAGASFQLNVVPTQPLDPVGSRYRVKIEGFGPAVPVVPRGVLENADAYHAADAVLGATYAPQGTTFRLFAPTAETVNVVLYDEATGGKGRAAHPLRRGAKGIWDAQVDGDLQGKCYVYVLEGPGLDPKREALDPYATNAVASSTRARINPPSAPPRPGPRLASPTDAVVYEMHVRDFTQSPESGAQNRGKYLGFAETGTHLPGDAATRTALDHLVELGVTHVELLPVQDYDNDEHSPHYNWGYIPQAYFSPEGSYASNPDDDSRVRELKALVDALHARNIGVIMDVVYNHTALAANFDALVPGYYYRHKPDDSPEDGSACGNDFRTEAPMARKLILDSLAHWTREYAVDGFRFDLMALVDQETMRQAERTVHAINPSAVIYGEPWTAAGSALPDKSDKTALNRLPVGAFNDDFRNALKGSPDGRDAGFIQAGARRDALKSALSVSGWFASPAQSVNYMTCHDNLVLWDKLKGSYQRADDGLLAETMKLGYLALFTAQGVPFLHGGEEFARTKGGNNNSYDAPDAVNQLDWSLKRKHADLFAYTRDAIALRRAHPVFRLRTREEVAGRLKFVDTPGYRSLAYTLDAAGVPDEPWKRACVVLNSDENNADIPLPEGQWTVALDERGTAAPGRTVAGTISVRRKSGLVLFQP